MENIVLKVQELGNYFLSVCNDEQKKYIIKCCLLNDNKINNLYFVKLLRKQDDTEDKSIVVKDLNDNETIQYYYSQVNEFIVNFSLQNNEDVKNKLKEYLDYFISVKDSINLEL